MNIVNLKILLLKVKKLFWIKASSLFDSILFFLPFAKIDFKTLSNNKKNIVFLGESLPPRIPRLAKWVKKEGDYNIYLICHKDGFVPKYAGEDWDKIVLFRNEWHLKRILKFFGNISIIHAFAPKSYYPEIARKNTNIPFVLDMQDVYTIYYGENHGIRWLYQELPHERNCLRNANGIVAQSLEPQIALKKLKIKDQRPKIFFPLYCDQDFFQEKRKEFNPENIHFVYAGNIAGSHRDKKQWGAIQLQWLIETLSQQQIHLHIYPSPHTLKIDYEEYFEIEKKDKYLHMHSPVAQEDLTKELCKYDFGIIPFFFKGNANDEAKYKYATTLKLFNHIEAGIPTLVSEDLIYQSWIINRYKAGISINRTDLNSIGDLLKKIDYPSLINNLLEERKKITIQKQMVRLLEFYKKVQKRK